jgi:hypothetical protein
MPFFPTFADGQGVNFVLDEFDPGGGGTVTCNGQSSGDISVPFEVRNFFFSSCYCGNRYTSCEIQMCEFLLSDINYQLEQESDMEIILQMYCNSKENRNGSQRDYLDALKVRKY